MKKIATITILLALIIFAILGVKETLIKPQNEPKISQNLPPKTENGFQEGDLIFQISLSEQSQAIQLATQSPYSHCGIIYKEGADFYVFEAIQPVKNTPLDKWIARGKDGHFVVKRLKNAQKIITTSTLANMKQVGQTFIGKNYDLTFEWSDDKIYCSELIWKVYQRATGFEIGKLEKLSSFDLSNPIVKTKMAERYGKKIPLNETVVSPKSVFDSEFLELVKTD